MCSTRPAALDQGAEGLLVGPDAPGLLPGIGAVRLQQPLQQGGPNAALREDHQHRAGRRIAFREDGAKPAFGFGAADQRGDEDLAGQPRAHWAR